MTAKKLRLCLIGSILLHASLIFVVREKLPAAQTPLRVMETFIIASPAGRFEETKRSIAPPAERALHPRLQKMTPRPPVPAQESPPAPRPAPKVVATAVPPQEALETEAPPLAESLATAPEELTTTPVALLSSPPQEKEPESQSFSSSQQNAATGQVMMLGEDGAPRFIQRELPIYPFIARKLGKEGAVVLMLALDSQGQLQGIEIVEENGFGFAEAARAAIKKSTFAPAIRDGRAIPSQVLVSVRFVLQAGQ